MTTQELKAVLLAEHKRDLRLMFTGYGIIAAVALIIIGLVVTLIVKTGGSISGVAAGAASEFTSGAPTYVKLVLPLAFLIALGYLIWSYVKLAKRPQTIDEFVKLVENGTRVVSIAETKDYRVKIPLYVVNYHTGAVQSFVVSFEGVKKGFILPVPFRYTEVVKDLLNENS